MLKPNYCTKFDIILHEKMHDHDLSGTFFRFELSCILVELCCYNISTEIDHTVELKQSLF